MFESSYLLQCLVELESKFSKINRQSLTTHSMCSLSDERVAKRYSVLRRVGSVSHGPEAARSAWRSVYQDV